MARSDLRHSFDPVLAVSLGVTGAVIVESFRHWIALNAAAGRNQHDGRTWTYNTYEALAGYFPYLGVQAVRREITKLTTAGILVTGNYNKRAGDRTKWYAFADEASNLPAEYVQVTNCRNRHMELSESTHGTVEIDSTTSVEIDAALPVNTTVTNHKGVNQEALADFLEYRRERKLAKYTEKGLAKVVDLMAQYPKTTQREMVDTTIRNNWQGIFPPKGGANGNTGNNVGGNQNQGRLSAVDEVKRERERIRQLQERSGANP